MVPQSGEEHDGAGEESPINKPIGDKPAGDANRNPEEEPRGEPIGQPSKPESDPERLGLLIAAGHHAHLRVA
jgi:hypothetical protein